MNELRTLYEALQATAEAIEDTDNTRGHLIRQLHRLQERYAEVQAELEQQAGQE